MGIFDFIGGWGNRTIYGTRRADNISDTDRSDTIKARGGNDTISLTYGDDQVHGGDGNDTVEVMGALSEYEIIIPQFLVAPPPDEKMLILSHPEYGEKTIRYVENIIDEQGGLHRVDLLFQNRIWGTDGDDVIQDSNIDDFISTHGGDDQISLTYGDDTVYGGQGLDIVTVAGELSDYIDLPPQNPNLPVVPDVRIRHEEYGTKNLTTSVELVQDKDGDIRQLQIIDIAGSTQGDRLVDTAWDDYLNGQAGDDMLYLTTGKDNAYGGEGYDIAHVSGSLDDYIISAEDFGGLELVVHMYSEEYGDKTLSNIETIMSEDGGVLNSADLLA